MLIPVEESVTDFSSYSKPPSTTTGTDGSELLDDDELLSSIIGIEEPNDCSPPELPEYTIIYLESPTSVELTSRAAVSELTLANSCDRS
jgi:hypothetical protein